MSKPELSISILKTLCYADLFSYPLSFSEVRNFLIYHQPTPPSFLKAALRQLVAVEKISLVKGYYCLNGREKLVKIRLSREARALTKLKIADKVANYLKRLPSVQAVALTGTLAMHNSRDGDDIDLLIITSSGKLWLTRLLIIGLLPLIAKRRKSTSFSTDFRNQICLNLFLDINNLQVPRQKQNLYTAHELVQAKFIFAKNGLDRKFLYVNRWLKQFLPNSQIPRTNDFSSPTSLNQSASFLEGLAFRLQCRYMKKKRTTEIIGLGRAYFHPGRTAEKILKAYAARSAQIIKTP